MENSLIKEYKELLYRKVKVESEILTLPSGYISKKQIRGNTYSYLQKRISDKITSKYLKNDEVNRVIEGIALRKQYEMEITRIKERLNELEKAAYFIDKALSRKLMLFKTCAGMDEIDFLQKERSILFANAMTAIEGVPISEQATKDIYEWKEGKKSFLTVYEDTLQRYGFL